MEEIDYAVCGGLAVAIHIRPRATVDVDPDLFKSVMGDFTDLGAATTLAASGGIPVITINGPQGVEAVRVESVWVEAQVDGNVVTGILA